MLEVFLGIEIVLTGVVFVFLKRTIDAQQKTSPSPSTGWLLRFARQAVTDKKSIAT